MQSARPFIWVYDRQMVPESVFKAHAPAASHGLRSDPLVGPGLLPRCSSPVPRPEHGVEQSRGGGPPGCQAAAPSPGSSNTGLSKQPSLPTLPAAPAGAVLEPGAVLGTAGRKLMAPAKSPMARAKETGPSGAVPSPVPRAGPQQRHRRWLSRPKAKEMSGAAPPEASRCSNVGEAANSVPEPPGPAGLSPLLGALGGGDGGDRGG